jgi:hypothetical protein
VRTCCTPFYKHKPYHRMLRSSGKGCESVDLDCWSPTSACHAVARHAIVRLVQQLLHLHKVAHSPCQPLRCQFGSHTVRMRCVEEVPNRGGVQSPVGVELVTIVCLFQPNSMQGMGAYSPMFSFMCLWRALRGCWLLSGECMPVYLPVYLPVYVPVYLASFHSCTAGCASSAC